MDELAEQEKLKDYQNRISEWIGNQGVFFQLRYARRAGASSTMNQLSGLILKLVIFSALFVGLGYFLVGRHFESDSYEAKISGQVEKVLGVRELKAKGFTRSRWNGGYRTLHLEGGDESFFYDAKLIDLSAPFSYFTGLTKAWNPGLVKIKKAEFSLKAGGDSKEMEDALAGVLKSLEGDGVSSIMIADFSCDWGYSKLTYGRIANTEFRADLEEGKWVASFSGGTFQQNWLSDFELTEGLLNVDHAGIEVVSLSLRHGKGMLDLAGRIGGPLSKPAFALNGRFSDLALEDLIEVEGVAVNEFLEGNITGELQVSGSTNSRVKIEGSAGPSAESSIKIRERWPVLKAISIIDQQRTFRRIDFTEGSFRFATENGSLKISELDLLAKGSAQLIGSFVTRLPSQNEAAENLGITLTKGFSSDSTDTSVAQQLEDERMSLSDALSKRSRVDDLEFDRSREESIAPVEVAQVSSKELEGLRLREEMKVHRIKGDLRLAIPASSFSENENLAKIYPVDGEGWRWLEISLTNSQFTTISEALNEKILDAARTRSSSFEELDF